MWIVALFGTLILSLVLADDTTTQKKIVIDNDAGADDALAIFLTLLYEKYHNGPQLIALTTGNGNTVEDNVHVNNQRILKKAKRQDVPIYRGSKSSLVTTPKTTNYYGFDGLGDTGEPLIDLVPAKEGYAAYKLIELSKEHEGNLIVVTIGTLTNVALAIKLDPNFLSRLDQLYIGAGHIHSDENQLPAEFNARMDVEGYHIVAQNATSSIVTVLPFSQVMTSLDFSSEWRKEVFGIIDTDIVKALNLYEQVTLAKEEKWHALDPAVLAIVVKPDLVSEYKYTKNDIILCGKERGKTTNTFVNKTEANVRLAYSIKTEEYRQFLINLFSNDA